MNFFVFAYTRLATRELKCMVDRTNLYIKFNISIGSGITPLPSRPLPVPKNASPRLRYVGW